MTVARNKQPRIGDIVEIKTSKGFAYALYSHEHKGPDRMGSLLRILPGIFSKRPENFLGLVEQKEQFAVFFPLRAAIKQRIVQIVGHEELPAWAVAFPLFRNGEGGQDEDEEVDDWWLWDGKKEWSVGQLTSEMRFYPELQIVNDTALVEMIEDGYRPEDHV
jgi:hypothetical protein